MHTHADNEAGTGSEDMLSVWTAIGARSSVSPDWPA